MCFTRSLFFFPITLMTGFLLLSGCSSSEKKESSESSLTVKGSDTMVILNQRWAEEFMKKNPEIEVQVTGGGSGTGIAALLNGSTDLASSSRSMKEKEKQAIEKKYNKKVVEISVALDALTIFVNSSNPINELTLEQLKAVFTGSTKNWEELGAQENKIIVYSRENNSGSYEFFKEHVLKGSDFSREASYLPGTASIVNAIQNDEKGIGFGGIAYLPTGVKAIKIKRDPNSPGIEPTLQNAQSQKYPLSRHLFYYTRGESSGLEKRFIEFALSPSGQKICEEVGYFPL